MRTISRLTPPRPIAAFWAALAPYVRLALLFPRAHRGLAIALALGVMLGTALPLAMTVAIGGLVGSVPEAIGSGSDSEAARTSIGWLIAVGGLIVGTQALFRARAAVAYSLGLRLNQYLALRVMRALNRPFGIAHLEDPATQDLVRRTGALSGTEGYSPGAAVGALTFEAGNWLLTLGYVAVLARFNMWLAGGLVLVVLVASHVQRRDYLRVTKVVVGQAGVVRRADYWRDLGLSPGAAKEVRVWGLTDWLTGRFADEFRRVMVPAWAERARGTPMFVVTILSVATGIFVVLAFAAVAATRGEIGLDELVVYALAAPGVTAILARGNHDFLLANGTDVLPAVLELERIGRDRTPVGGAAGGASANGMPARAIDLGGVTFRYAGSDTDVLTELDLSIDAGRSLAIVGANGAGKTTLVKLLARLYEPTEGEITVDGVGLREIDPRAWQRQISAIFQDFSRYELTARDNVTFGAVERAGDERALVAAAERAGALEFVNELSGGWETRLSRQYAGGAELSDGQWQRLALARALFAAAGQASVLVLDEPTAHLDVRAEAALYDDFLELTQGLTTVIISHRFSTVRNADRIVVLENGRVVEDGTHDSLLALDERYAEMFNVQAARFQDASAQEPVDV